MSTAKRIFSNFKVIIVLVAIVLALISLSPNPFRKGAAIRSVVPETPSALAGISSPSANSAPMSREVITAVNSISIKNAEEYYSSVSKIKPNTTVKITTNKGVYSIYSSNKTDANGFSDLGMRVYDAPTSNIRKGLDLQGGIRTILKPEANATKENVQMTIESMKQRLNVYGLSDVVVKETSDLSGNRYILIEIAGAYEDEVKELISKQGKFEAKIGNETIFRGGKDITYVCKTAECSGIDTQSGCGKASDGTWSCKFMFSVSLSPNAASVQANATGKLSSVYKNGENFLNETLDLFLDDQKVDSLEISEELKGKALTDVAVSGSGRGATKEEAIYDALKSMKRLQTIMITGSLPIKLEVVKTDTISPTLGEKFLKNTASVFLVAITVVCLVLFFYYRNVKVAGMIMATGLIEIFLTMGLLTLMGWNIDLAAIAGFIAAVGANVDDQIVMSDEAIKGKGDKNAKRMLSWKEKIKSAFYIIIGGYLTTVASALPLLFAGAGLLKGFAITTIVGLTIGIVITRPAYADVIEILLKKD
ncbi:MAG: hypothetical protein NTV63_04430 [Candidatus Woesearchaeota archaeon]|nr:hypothetical protein [Candidatus Woesearchaeota archaeon]